MKTFQFALIVILASFVWSTLQAAPAARTARVEIVGNWSSDAVDLDVDSVSEGGKATGANWPGTDPAKHVIIEFPANAGWKQASFTFIPHKTGRVALSLLGAYVRISSESKELIPVLIAYDDFKIEGATLKNPSFETADATGNPENWRVNNSTEGLPPIDDRNRAKILTGNVVDGEKALRVWHNSRVHQSLQVEAEKPVTITFSYRLAEQG